jgi:hypothetical protein
MWEAMNAVRVKHVAGSGFRGDDVVLLALDGGPDVLLATLIEAARTGSGRLTAGKEPIFGGDDPD